MLESNEIEQAVRNLPPQARKELWHFVDFLQHKYQADRPKEVVQLGGLWADLDWNVSDEDVRALRRQVTNQLLKKI